MYCYIHIPFCESKCDYCRFASYAGLDEIKVNFYVDFLCREIEITHSDSPKLKSVYFGGGTPSILSIAQIEKILVILEKKYGFEKNIEITLETTPENVELGMITDLRNIGVNRMSMGIQSLNNKTLKEIKRKPSSEIYRALEIINLGIIPNVSVDFIIGLPFVRKGELQQYIHYVLENYDIIKHVSVYMLEDYYEASDEQDSKFQKVVYPVNWSKDGLSEADFLSEYIQIKKYLKKEGFGIYEISNFAKKGYACIHNQAYWDHSELLAFGLGASGFVNGKRYMNSDDFGEYYRGENIQRDRLDPASILLEKVMFGLRTNGFDKELLGDLNEQKFHHLKSNDLLQEKGGKVLLGKKGYTLLDTIVLELVQ